MSKRNPSPPGGGAPVCIPYEETDKVFYDFREDCLKVQKPLGDGAAAVAKTNFESAFQTVCEDRKTLKYGEDTRNIYNDIYYNIAISLSKDLAEAGKCVEAQITATADLGKAFSTAVAKLKEACAKIQEAQMLAQSLGDSANKTCNADTVAKVTAKLKEKQGDAKYPFQKDVKGTLTPVTDLHEVLGLLKTDAKDCFDLANKSTERAVKVASIYTFLNVQQLKEYTDKLNSQSDAFKKDSESNLKNADDKIKAALKSLGDDLVKLSETEAAWMKAKANADSITNTGNDISGIDNGVFKIKNVGPCSTTDKPVSPTDATIEFDAINKHIEAVIGLCATC